MSCSECSSWSPSPVASIGRCTHPAVRGREPSAVRHALDGNGCPHFAGDGAPYGPGGASSRTRELRRRLMGYLKGEWSLLSGGPVVDAVRDARLAACRRCPHLLADEAGSPGWCAKCRCGKSSRAAVGLKVLMPEANCPVGSWPESREAKGREALAELGGIRSQVADIVNAATERFLGRGTKGIEP